jgi:uncharacterized protein (DUF362 family)
MARVSLVRTGNDIYRELTGVIDGTGEQFIRPGDRVLIKPNLVEPKEPNGGEITTPRLIEAVARYCLDRGAGRVIIGEGPSYYQPESDLRKCFTRTGVSQVAERLGIDWVLFDEHEYRTFRGVPDCPKEFRVTEFAFNCDRIINLPVLKTHYQTTVTLAMKNLKGCLKREDKPRFHQVNLAQAVVALNKIVRPTINVIDGTPKTIGSIGNSSRRRDGAGLLIASTDIVAVDAVGSALMGIDPAEVSTVALGAAAGLGEMDLTRMNIIGEEIKRLKFRVELPWERLRRSFPGLEIIGAEHACSGCLIPLISSLQLIEESGNSLRKSFHIYVGEEPREYGNTEYLRVGDCALGNEEETPAAVRGCPPDREELLRSLVKIMNE